MQIHNYVIFKEIASIKYLNNNTYLIIYRNTMHLVMKALDILFVFQFFITE